MNDMTTIAKPRGARGKKAPIVGAEPIATAIVVPAAPQPFPLRQLRRAPENVRHQRVDEDVPALADDIAAHGLLQSLIGYLDADGLVQIVGGGRRFQALREVENRGLIDGGFPVPVLIRDLGEAVELSLAENLQQRTMSPVDEFLAFKTLMENGTNSPEILAKRFGFTERVVKQRLRLADLAPEILDALAARDITLDAAMAYASSQDTHLQREVFKVQGKRSWEPHRANNIRHDLRMKGMSTASPLFKFVGAEIYEREGGGYEDDLFDEPGAERQLTHPFLVETKAREMLDFQMIRLEIDAQRREDLSPTIVGYVVPPDLRIHSWGTQAKLKAPAGFAQVEKYEHKKMWRTIRNNAIDAYVLVGIDGEGMLRIWERIAFVPAEQKLAVAPASVNQGHVPPTPEQQAATTREREVDRWSRRLAVPPFAGTDFEGRAFWPEAWDDRSRDATVGGVPGWLVSVQIFVPDAQIAAARPLAEQHYEEALAAKAADEAAAREVAAASERRRVELLAIAPPAIAVIDGLAWVRGDDGTYAPLEDAEDGYVGSWTALLANFDIDDVGATYADRAEFEDAITVADVESRADA